jgi:flavin-dependent dehydrogenase
MTDLYDLAVIGGGPAGCSAAITARHLGANVLLLDRAKFPRQKVCGEFVSSEAHELLRDLLGEDFARALFETAIAVDSGRIFMDGRVVSTRVEPAATSLPRFDMDFALWRAAEAAGVHALQQTAVHGVERNSEGIFSLETANAPYSARAVINASGRWSNLRASAEAIAPNPKWLGVKAHYLENQPRASVDLYFFPGGYCGVQPVSESQINVCAMVRADAATNLPEVFGCNSQLLKRSSGWTQVGEAVSTAPLIFRDPSPIAGNLLLVGDAAGFIDPFVGDGISMALHSGRMAASSVRSFLDGDCSLEKCAQNYADEYRHKLLPAFKHAARARRMVSAPWLIRSAALTLLDFSGLTEFLVNKTRARIA